MKNTSLSGWRCLSEHYVPAEPGPESFSIQQVAESVKNLGLEPGQVERIQEAIRGAIKESINSDEGIPDHLALLIRLWVPELDRTGIEDPSGCRIGSYGQGFFLIEKTIGEPGNPWKVSCRMVDVLVYGKKGGSPE